MITVPDDDWVRTHDEARDLLRYAVIGATAIIEPFEKGERLDGARRWTLVLDGAPEHAANLADAYHLPCLAAPLARRAQALAEEARAALAKRRRILAH